MNVNPFSYLIEKLKGKVDKSGDTMTGQLNIVQSNNNIPLTLKGHHANETWIKYLNNTGAELGYLGFEKNDAKIKPSAYYEGAYHTLALKSDLDTNVCFVNVANENTSYTPTKEGLYAYGNKGASTTSFAFVYLLKNTTYTVTQAGLGLGSDPAPGNPKYLFAIKPNI